MPTITCVEDPSITYTSPPLPPVKKKKGLWISFGTNIRREAQYKDGELLDAKNRPYKKGGVKRKKDGTVEIKDTYLLAVVTALDKIAKAEQEIGTNVIKTLQESKFKFTIYDEMNMFTPNQFGERTNTWMNNACANQIELQEGKLVVDGAPFDGIGTGGLIRWRSKHREKIETNIGIKESNPMLSLAHEMYHAYDANFGNLDRRRIPTGKILSSTEFCEARAVYYANQLRSSSEFNLKYLRVTYNDGDYKLLNKDNESIYFPSPSERLKTK